MTDRLKRRKDEIAFAISDSSEPDAVFFIENDSLSIIDLRKPLEYECSRLIQNLLLKSFHEYVPDTQYLSFPCNIKTSKFVERIFKSIRKGRYSVGNILKGYTCINNLSPDYIILSRVNGYFKENPQVQEVLDFRMMPMGETGSIPMVSSSKVLVKEDRLIFETAVVSTKTGKIIYHNKVNVKEKPNNPEALFNTINSFFPMDSSRNIVVK